DNKYYLPGSSLRGVLRHRAQAICKTVMGKPDLAETLFGYVDKKRGARKSLIEIADGKIQNGKDAGPVFFDHVAIDRIVNCAEDGAKFSASALVSPVFSVAITMRFHDEYLSELGLWGFVLRDLMEGRLWAGHGTSRGYGYIAMAELQKCALSVPGSMQLAPAEDWSLSSGRGRFIAEKNKPLLFDDLSWVWNKADDSWVKARSHASGGKS
ncbi:MAG: RAMP superfamily CRISPR-associated protein, partial [Syntrophobacteraceae bacterium]